MRRFRGNTRQFIGGSFPAAAVNAQNIHIHVTNVTQVMPVRVYPSAVPKRYPPKRTGAGFERKPIERPPKLFRYCASGGLIDGDIVYGMESDDLCVEAAKVCGYSAHKIGQSVGSIADHTISAAGHAVGIVGGVCGLACSLFGMVKACFEE